MKTNLKGMNMKSDASQKNNSNRERIKKTKRTKKKSGDSSKNNPRLKQLVKKLEGKLSVGDNRACGEILLMIKEELKFGKFMSWVEREDILDYKTANRYMRVAKVKSSDGKGISNSLQKKKSKEKFRAKTESTKNGSELNSNSISQYIRNLRRAIRKLEKVTQYEFVKEPNAKQNFKLDRQKRQLKRIVSGI